VTTIIYPTGRFTGGSNYVDQLGPIYPLTPQNFAIGGALTDNSNTNPFLPGFTFERTSFLAGGGGVFPPTSSPLGPNDLVTVSIGGNDARVYGSSVGASVAGAPAAAAIAVGSATNDPQRNHRVEHPDDQLPRREYRASSGSCGQCARPGDPRRLFERIQPGDADDARR